MNKLVPSTSLLWGLWKFRLYDYLHRWEWLWIIFKTAQYNFVCVVSAKDTVKVDEGSVWLTSVIIAYCSVAHACTAFRANQNQGQGSRKSRRPRLLPFTKGWRKTDTGTGTDYSSPCPDDISAHKQSVWDKPAIHKETSSLIDSFSEDYGGGASLQRLAIGATYPNLWSRTRRRGGESGRGSQTRSKHLWTPRVSMRDNGQSQWLPPAVLLIGSW